MPTDLEPTPRVFVYEDLSFGRQTLARIVEDAGCGPIVPGDGKALTDALDAATPPLALVIVSLEPDRAGRLRAIAELRKRDWLSSVPIAGVCAWSAELDLWQLRALGVVGLIDTRARAEHVRFRIGQIVYRGREGRRHERAPCDWPVAVEAEGDTLVGRAITVSVGGMGLVCARPIPPNTPVRLRFRPDDGSDEIEVAGRSVHVRDNAGDGNAHEMGVIFHRLSRPTYTALFAAVTRLLAAWGSLGAILPLPETQRVPATDPKR